MSYTLSIGVALGSTNTGLTLAAQLVDTSGANVGGSVTAGIVELGGGNYLATLTVPDGHRGAVKFTSGSIVVAAPINPQEAEYADVKTSTRAALGTAITVTSPVAESGSIEIIRGDDYSNSDSRALDFANTAGSWPDLSSATIVLRARPAPGFVGPGWSKAGSVVTATGSGQRVRVALTAAETANLGIGRGSYSYMVVATLSSGRVATLATGSATVLQEG